jgi:thiol:disulfide interchange protein
MADGTLKVGTITTSSGSGTITIPSGVSLSGGVANTPAFEANMSSSQSVAQNTLTIAAYNAENFDTDNAYDTSTYKFTPQTAGKYFVYAKARLDDSGDSDANEIQLFKNTTKFAETTYRQEYYEAPLIVGVTTLNGSTDFIQVKIYHNFAGSKNYNNAVFGAYKIIGA